MPKAPPELKRARKHEYGTAQFWGELVSLIDAGDIAKVREMCAVRLKQRLDAVERLDKLIAEKTAEIPAQATATADSTPV